MTKQAVYIGLGSNLQDPIAQIKQALNNLTKIPNTDLIKVSSLYSSKSLLPDQPNYVNAIACLHTSLSAESLLNHLQHIENTQGRQRVQHWGARTLDLDIILYGNEQIDTPSLTVPHSQMALRSFVLVPLIEINPELILPSGQPIQTLLKNCPSQNLQKI